MKEAAGIVAGERSGWFSLTINILFVSREEIVNVTAVPNADLSLCIALTTSPICGAKPSKDEWVTDMKV